MNIKLDIPTKEIIRLFNEARDNPHKTVNLKTNDGYVYISGGILSMLKGAELYVAVGKQNKMRWELVWVWNM